MVITINCLSFFSFFQRFQTFANGSVILISFLLLCFQKMASSAQKVVPLGTKIQRVLSISMAMIVPLGTAHIAYNYWRVRLLLVSYLIFSQIRSDRIKREAVSVRSVSDCSRFFVTATWIPRRTEEENAGRESKGHTATSVNSRQRTRQRRRANGNEARCLLPSVTLVNAVCRQRDRGRAADGPRDARVHPTNAREGGTQVVNMTADCVGDSLRSSCL